MAAFRSLPFRAWWNRSALVFTLSTSACGGDPSIRTSPLPLWREVVLTRTCSEGDNHVVDCPGAQGFMIRQDGKFFSGTGLWGRITEAERAEIHATSTRVARSVVSRSLDCEASDPNRSPRAIEAHGPRALARARVIHLRHRDLHYPRVFEEPGDGRICRRSLGSLGAEREDIDELAIQVEALALRYDGPSVRPQPVP